MYISKHDLEKLSISSDELQALIIYRVIAFTAVPLSQIFATEIYQVVQDLVCHLHSNNQLAMNGCMQGYVEHLYKVCFFACGLLTSILANASEICEWKF